MHKTEFIAWLESIPGNPVIQTFDADVGEWHAVTGAVYDEETMQLYCDDPC